MYKPPSFELLNYVDRTDLWAAGVLAANGDRGRLLAEFDRRVEQAHAMAGAEHQEWLTHRLALTRGWIDRRSRPRTPEPDRVAALATSDAGDSWRPWALR